jgi:hypothetical protein
LAQRATPPHEAVEAGGFVSYSPSHTELWQRAATISPSLLLRAQTID